MGQGIERAVLWPRIGSTVAGTWEGRSLLASRGRKTALDRHIDLRVKRDGRSGVGGVRAA